MYSVLFRFTAAAVLGVLGLAQAAAQNALGVSTQVYRVAVGEKAARVAVWQQKRHRPALTYLQEAAPLISVWTRNCARAQKIARIHCATREGVMTKLLGGRKIEFSR